MTDDIQRSSHKPEKDLVNYTTVRVPELRPIYRRVRNAAGFVKRSTLRRELAPVDDDHLTTCLRYLQSVDLVESEEERVIEVINEDVFPELSFEPRLLYHLHQQQHPQNHVMEAQRVAFGMAPKTLRRDQLEVELNGELDHIAWNQTKLNGWYRLLQGVGVLSYIDSRELVLSPRPVLLYELLETFRDEENSTDFGEAVAWLEDRFLAVLTTRSGSPRLHQGVTDTLQTLLDEEYLEVLGMSDAETEIVLPSTQTRTQEPAITEFELHGWPTDPSASKRYPLDQFVEGAP